MGKSVLYEDPSKGFGGIYVGDVSDPEVKEAVEATDLMIVVGGLRSDFNSGEFSYKVAQTNLIELHSARTVVQYAHYPSVPFHTLLPALTKTLKPKNIDVGPKHAGLLHDVPDSPKNEMVTQAAFWPLVGKFLKEDDVILAGEPTEAFRLCHH